MSFLGAYYKNLHGFIYIIWAWNFAIYSVWNAPVAYFRDEIVSMRNYELCTNLINLFKSSYKDPIYVLMYFKKKKRFNLVKKFQEH